MHDRRERFQRLYEANYGSILGYARRRTSTAEDALDVVSETFMTAWRRLDDLPGGEHARLWLYGTARRVLANHHRGLRRRSDLLERLRSEPGAASEDPTATIDGPDRSAVAVAFARLAENDQEILILVGWEHLDAGEVAEVLGCTRASARVRLHRARKRFAAALAAQGLQRTEPAGHGTSRWALARPDSEEAR